MRRALLNASVVGAALVGGLDIAEIALRLIGFSYPPFHQLWHWLLEAPRPAGV